MNFDMNWFDDKGVSPVVGVILMVAVTVILSAVVGTFALDLGNNTKDNARGGVSIDENPSTGEVTVTVVSGGNSDGFVVKTVAGTTTLSGVGDSVTVDSYGEAVSVIGANNGKSNVIQRYEPSHELDGDLLVVESDSTVATTTTYSSLQSAVDDASDGDTVLVKSGTYSPVSIDGKENLTLVSEANATISGSGAGVLVNASGVTVKGFQISADAAIDVDKGAKNVLIRNNTLDGGAYSLTADGDGLTVVHNDIKSSLYQPINLDSNNSVIRNNVIAPYGGSSSTNMYSLTIGDSESTNASSITVTDNVFIEGSPDGEISLSSDAIGTLDATENYFTDVANTTAGVDTTPELTSKPDAGRP